MKPSGLVHAAARGEHAPQLLAVGVACAQGCRLLYLYAHEVLWEHRGRSHAVAQAALDEGRHGFGRPPLVSVCARMSARSPSSCWHSVLDAPLERLDDSMDDASLVPLAL